MCIRDRSKTCGFLLVFELFLGFADSIVQNPGLPIRLHVCNQAYDLHWLVYMWLKLHNSPPKSYGYWVSRTKGRLEEPLLGVGSGNETSFVFVSWGAQNLYCSLLTLLKSEELIQILLASLSTTQQIIVSQQNSQANNCNATTHMAFSSYEHRPSIFHHVPSYM